MSRNRLHRNRTGHPDPDAHRSHRWQQETHPSTTAGDHDRRIRLSVTVAAAVLLLLAIWAVVADRWGAAIVLLVLAIGAGVLAYRPAVLQRSRQSPPDTTATLPPSASYTGYPGTPPTAPAPTGWPADATQPPRRDDTPRTIPLLAEDNEQPAEQYYAEDATVTRTSTQPPAAPTTTASAYLRNQLDAQQPALALTGEVMRLGRSRRSDLIVSDETVSRTHAVLLRDQRTGLWAVQAASDAPTLIGGRQHHPADPPVVVHDADVVVFGATVWQIDYPDTADPLPVAHDQAPTRPSPAPPSTTPQSQTRNVQPTHPPQPMDGQQPSAAAPAITAPPRIIAAGETSAGTRPNNNDVFLIKGTAAAIADAVGGGQDGATTATTVRSVLRDYLPNVRTRHQVREVFDATDGALCQLRTDPAMRSAAATLDVLAYDPSSSVITGGHLGDSQVFRVRTTADGNRQLQVSAMTPTTPDNAVLTEVVGFFADNPTDAAPTPVIWAKTATPGDIYVMVTDGFLNVWKSCSPAEAIAAALHAHPDATPGVQSSTLVHSALQEFRSRENTPSLDNITVVVVHVVNAT